MPASTNNRPLAVALLLTIALPFTSWAGSALGQPSEPATGEPSLSGPALELFRAGQAARDAGNYSACYEHALGAWKLHQRPAVAALLGDCAFDVKRYAAAAEHLTYYLDHRPPNAPGKLVGYARDRLAQATEKVATVRLTVSPAGAEIRLDDRRLGEAPLTGPVFVAPGPATLSIRAEGHQTTTRTITVEAAGELQLDIALQPSAAPPPPPPDGGDGLPLWPALVGGGAAVALAGVGLAFVMVSAGQHDDAQAERDRLSAELGATGERCPAAPGCSELGTMFADAQSSQESAIALLSGAGVAALFTGVYTALYASQPEAETTSSLTIHLLPTATPRLAGAAVVGTF